jgi:hypothetical protein
VLVIFMGMVVSESMMVESLWAQLTALAGNHLGAEFFLDVFQSFNRRLTGHRHRPRCVTLKPITRLLIIDLRSGDFSKQTVVISQKRESRTEMKMNPTIINF